jgi:hypothetical protein
MSDPDRLPNQRLADCPTSRLNEIRAKLRSIDVESLPSEDLEYASDLQYLLAELVAAERARDELEAELKERDGHARRWAERADELAAELERERGLSRGRVQTWREANEQLKRRANTLTEALNETRQLAEDASKHITEDLQPEFARLAETGTLTWPDAWRSTPYDQSQAAQRLATWWHGVSTDETFARADEALSSLVPPHGEETSE